MPDERKTAQSKESKAHVEHWDAALVGGYQNAVARWMETLLALGQEITSFTLHRVQEDADTLVALAACRNPAQAIEHQQRFVAKASQEYADETIGGFGRGPRELIERFRKKLPAVLREAEKLSAELTASVAGRSSRGGQPPIGSGYSNRARHSRQSLQRHSGWGEWR